MCSPRKLELVLNCFYKDFVLLLYQEPEAGAKNRVTLQLNYCTVHSVKKKKLKAAPEKQPECKAQGGVNHLSEGLL